MLLMEFFVKIHSQWLIQMGLGHGCILVTYSFLPSTARH